MAEDAPTPVVFCSASEFGDYISFLKLPEIVGTALYYDSLGAEKSSTLEEIADIPEESIKALTTISPQTPRCLDPCVDHPRFVLGLLVVIFRQGSRSSRLARRH